MCHEKRKIDLNSSGTNDTTEPYVPPDAHTKTTTHQSTKIFFFFSSHFYFPASGQAMVTGVVPSPRFLPSIFIAHRVQQSHCSSIFHRVSLTPAVTTPGRPVWNNPSRINRDEYAPVVSRGSCWRGRRGPFLPCFVLLASSPDLPQIPCCAHACCCSTLIPISFAGCPSTAIPLFPIIVAQNCS